MATHPADYNLWVVGLGENVSIRPLPGGCRPSYIPVGLVIITELDFQYGLIPKTLGNDEEKAVQGLQECCGATISVRPIIGYPSGFTPLKLAKNSQNPTFKKPA